MKAKNAKSSSLEKIIDRQSLAEGSNPFLVILKNLPDAVLLIDFAGDVYYANRQAKNLFGFDSAKSRTIGEILPPTSILQRKSRRLAHWRTVEANRTIRNFETQFLDRDGRLVEARVTETAIFDSGGKMVGFSAVIRDITKTRESERRITRRDRQLFALINVAEAITHLTDVESLPENILDAVLRVASLSFGCVHLFDEEHEGVVCTTRDVTDEKLIERRLIQQERISASGKVDDNGNGIPIDALPNVFNPFFTANKEGGTGLGLAISSHIVQKHSGILTIENNREYSVTAKIRLPLSQI